MFLKLAWRNIWRSKRRSLITIGSIFFAILFSNLMQSLQQGIWEKSLSATMSLSGYIQVQVPEFWDEPILDNGIEVQPEYIERIQKINNVQVVTPRIQSGALAAHGTLSKFAFIHCISPQLEEKILHLESKIESGTLLTDDDQGIIIGSGMAKYFDISVGDTLSMLGQGYHGASANANFPIRGIIKYGSDQMSGSLVIMPLLLAQKHFDAPNVATSLHISLDNIDQLEKTQAKIQEALRGEDFIVMNWKEMMPELLQAYQADAGGNVIFLFVLYLIIGFGIFGTVLMMTTERMYEFGVMVSVGMKRYKLSFILFLETVFLSALGVFIGSIVSYPIMYYYMLNPIPMTGQAAEAMREYGFDAVISGSINPAILYENAAVILIIIALVNIYPAIVISKLKPIKAMRK